jgi:hypothetical protein
MTFQRAAMFAVCASVAVAAVAGSARAEAPTLGCTDAGVLVARPVALAVAVPLMPSDDVQWCVDADDPRCSPDPVGAPAAHVAHAGDAGQLARAVVVRYAPVASVVRTDREIGCAASAHRDDLERPPRVG